MLSTLRKLMAIVNRPGRYIAGLLMIGLVAASMNIFLGLSFMLFITAAETADFQQLIASTVYVLLTLVAVFVLMPLGYWLFDTAVVYSTANLRRRVFSRALRLTATWLEGKHSGDLTSRATNDVQVAELAYSTNIVNLVEVLFAGLGCGAAMLYVDWQLGLVIIVIGALRVWINSLFVKPLERASTFVQQALAKLTEGLSDIVNGRDVIRMFNLQQRMEEKYDGQNRKVVRHGLTRVRYSAIVTSFNVFNGDLAFLGLITVGGWLVMQGWYTLGTIVLFVQLQNGVDGLFRAFGQYITQLQTSLAGGRRVLEIVEEQPEPVRIELAQAGAQYSAAIAMAGVTFSYPNNSQPALDNVSFTARTGEVIALVGPSGGGKSTVFKLLLGFYPPDKGVISVLGRSIGNYTLQELRDQIALVPQSAHLFNGTVAENIGFGRFGATREEIVAAAKAANSHDFIMQLPEGYDTIIGERGSRLSGGQRQRIAIARAILKDAPILLLDEATSFLDTESEAMVQQALKEMMKGRTTLVIAHRLSTIRDADRILVIADGKVAEQGSHKDLLAMGGLYKYLHDLQFADCK